ncbi:MAG: ferrochelatase [Alphaproteobacteria bacterium]
MATVSGENGGSVPPRIAVVLFNLGGPDSLEAVQPFLFNLFNDSAIVRAPQPIRWYLATMISNRRARVARDIYAQIGGASPLLELTREQAAMLEAVLAGLGEVRVFIAMRYWHPMSEETALEVKAFDADEVVLLPLYPQFSTTTTASSLAAWRRAAEKAAVTARVRAVCCYPTAEDFVAAHAALIAPALADAGTSRPPRLLFSAHGLPKHILARGDPYVWQVERTAQAIAAALGSEFADLDWRVCYQSRVGPLEWVGPSTKDELARAGADGVPVVVAPIAFVSEHSETLVELDIEYRKLALENGVPAYVRVPALGTQPSFIAALAALVRGALDGAPGLCSHVGGRVCPGRYGGCPQPREGIEP